MNIQAIGNCPYCDSQYHGRHGTWGGSPDLFARMKAEHDAGHPTHRRDEDDLPVTSILPTLGLSLDSPSFDPPSSDAPSFDPPATPDFDFGGGGGFGGGGSDGTF